MFSAVTDQMMKKFFYLHDDDDFRGGAKDCEGFRRRFGRVPVRLFKKSTSNPIREKSYKKKRAYMCSRFRT